MSTEAERAAAEHPNCGMCEARVHEQEVVAGIRCAQCGCSFNKVGNYRHPEHPDFCNGCGSVQHTRSPLVGSWGAGRFRDVEH